MTHLTVPAPATLLLAALLCGCGSCSQNPPKTTVPAKAAHEASPAGKPAESPPAKSAAAPVAPQAAPATMPVGNPEEEEECFVLMDAEPDYGDAPAEVHFVTELDCGNKTVTYAWEFGDGTTAGNDANPVHKYEKPGEYLAVVTVTATDGSTGSDEIDIFLEDPKAKR